MYKSATALTLPRALCRVRAQETSAVRAGARWETEWVDVLVVEGARRRGRCVLAGLLLRGDDGLQVLPLPPLLAAVAVRCLRDLLRLVDGGLLDIGAIHIGLPRHALGCGLGVEGCWVRVAFRRSGRVGLGSSA